ncbi:MAG TPA: FHA domain-containing protein [Phycisphaerae bacterium]
MPNAMDINERTLVADANPDVFPDALLVSAAPTLVVLSDNDFGRVISIDRPQITMGRSPRADVVIADQEISRRHLMFRLNAEGLFCFDLGSTNGTFVNGRPITQQLIREGDQIRLGETVLKCTHAGG